jgi:hypothetical protein
MLATPAGFAAHHRSDRNFILALVAIIAIGVLGGFAWNAHLVMQQGEYSYPLVVHVHAVVFVGWLALLVTQTMLMRSGKPQLHKRLGIAALAWIPAMVLASAAVVLVRNAPALNPPDDQLSFICTQVMNVIAMAGALVAGLLMRRDGAAHKRLMLLGTIAISEPGLSRLPGNIGNQLYVQLSNALGEGVVPYFFANYWATLILLIAFGVYDRVTRKRFHPAFVAAFCWIIGCQLFASWLFYQPFWLGWMKALTGN